MSESLLERAATAISNLSMPAWASWVEPFLTREAKRVAELEAENARLQGRVSALETELLWRRENEARLREALVDLIGYIEDNDRYMAGSLAAARAALSGDKP